MAGRTPPEAVQNYVDPLQLAVSCVTDAVLNVGGGYYITEEPQEPHALVLANGDPVRLGGPHDITLAITQNYRIVEADEPRGPYKVATVAYFYTLEEYEGPEILSYQWHPRVPSSVAFPHLHLGRGTGITRREMTRTHLPTGRVALEYVIRLAIDCFEVSPRRGRENWSEILDETATAYTLWKTW